jgi:hypothetical protein
MNIGTVVLRKRFAHMEDYLVQSIETWWDLHSEDPWESAAAAKSFRVMVLNGLPKSIVVEDVFSIGGAAAIMGFAQLHNGMRTKWQMCFDAVGQWEVFQDDIIIRKHYIS